MSNENKRQVPQYGECKTCGSFTGELKNGKGFKVLCDSCQVGNGRLFAHINRFKKAKHDLKNFEDMYQDAFRLGRTIDLIKVDIQTLQDNIHDLQEKKKHKEAQLEDLLGDLECGLPDPKEYEELKDKVLKTKEKIEQELSQ